jgi:hypothetical protein
VYFLSTCSDPCSCILDITCVLLLYYCFGHSRRSHISTVLAENLTELWTQFYCDQENKIYKTISHKVGRIHIPHRTECMNMHMANINECLSPGSIIPISVTFIQMVFRMISRGRRFRSTSATVICISSAVPLRFDLCNFARDNRMP